MRFIFLSIILLSSGCSATRMYQGAPLPKGQFAHIHDSTGWFSGGKIKEIDGVDVKETIPLDLRPASM